MKITWRKTMAVGLAMFLTGIVGLWCWWPCELYRRFDSPSGAHRLMVYRYPSLMMMPGGSGGASGKVLLQDAAGHTLQLTSVDMVQNVESAEWTEHSVNVSSF
ncbi:MAG: uncharacterized protein JWO94_771 [Verrucomicrobiaceae bacterium]|nr:uncharacterized protein [Verrucomicrobiaceae bacterium]